jgi:hypothetical protein
VAEHLARERRRVGSAERLFQAEESGRGTGGGIAGDVFKVDALIKVDGARHIAGGEVGIGKGDVAGRLREGGIMVAQQADGLRRIVLERTGGQEPGAARPRRRLVGAKGGSEILGDAGKVARFDASRSQVISGVVGNRRELRGEGPESGDGIGILFLLKGDHAEGETSQAAAGFFGMGIGIGLYGDAACRRRSFAISVD